MESNPEAETAPKHTELKEDEKDNNEVVKTENKFIANIASPFIKQKL